MDELIDRLATKAGIDNIVAEKSIGIRPGFIRGAGPSDKVQARSDNIPGSEAAIAAGNPGRLMGNGLTAVGARLMALGLGISEIESMARELFKFCRDKVGADHMGEIIGETLGLSQFA